MKQSCDEKKVKMEWFGLVVKFLNVIAKEGKILQISFRIEVIKVDNHHITKE